MKCNLELCVAAALLAVAVPAFGASVCTIQSLPTLGFPNYDVFVGAPTVTSGTTGSVAENAATSTVVYTGTATDPDTTAPNNTIAWSLGVPWRDAGTIGNLLGTRMVLNEFIAFAQLGPMKAALDPRSFTVATFALCGFANLASIAIQVGGLGALAPTRKSDLARMGFKAVAAGTMARVRDAMKISYRS